MAKNDLQHKQDELSAIFVKQQEITNRQSEHVAAGSRPGAGAGSGDLGALFFTTTSGFALTIRRSKRRELRMNGAALGKKMDEIRESKEAG